MLADSAGEDKRIEPVHGRGHRGDGGHEAVRVHVEREGGGGFPAVGRRGHVPVVAAAVSQARQRGQARPVLKRIGQLGRRDPVGEPGDQAGIDASRPGGHDKAVDRRESHRGVHAVAAPHGR